MGLKRIFCCFFILICSKFLCSQDHRTDSVKPTYGFKKIDSIRNSYFLPWKIIDTTKYPLRYNIQLEHLALDIIDQKTALLSWDHHDSIDSFLVEIRYDLNRELFHRKVYDTSAVIVPRGQLYKVYPFYKKMLGPSISYKNIPIKNDGYDNFWNILANLSLILTISLAIYHIIMKKRSK